MRTDYTLSQLDVLEAESIHVIREVAAEFERPALLFSGGKDSIVMLALAEKAFKPASIPFPVMHVDTGHNFAEVLEFRDKRVAELGVRLIVASVQDSIDSGRAVEETGRWVSRNRLQTVVRSGPSPCPWSPNLWQSRHLALAITTLPRSAEARLRRPDWRTSATSCDCV